MKKDFFRSFYTEFRTKKILFLLILIQLSVAINFITISIKGYQEQNYFKKQLKYLNNYLDYNKLYYFENIPYDKKLVNFIKDLEQGLGEKNIISFNSAILLFDELASNNELISLNKKYKVKEGYLETLPSFHVNYGAYENMGVTITQGKGLERKDFTEYVEGMEIPILVSEVYKEIMNLGDRFDTGYETYRVKGFFDSKYKFLNESKDLVGDFLISLEDKIILPQLLYMGKNKELESFMNGMYGQTFYIMNSDKTDSEFEKIVAQNIKKYNVQEAIGKVEDNIKYNNKLTQKVNISNISRIIIAIIFSFLSIGIVTKYSVEGRLREFAIRKSCGASERDIFKLIMFEKIILVSVAIVLALIPTIKYFRYEIYSYGENTGAINNIMGIILLSALSLFILIYVFTKVIFKKTMKKKSLSQLIGGE